VTLAWLHLLSIAKALHTMAVLVCIPARNIDHSLDQTMKATNWTSKLDFLKHMRNN